MMNDSAELDHGLELIREVWESQRPDLDDEHCKRVEEVLFRADQGSREGLFIACASPEKDSLCQYRAYGAYALGLDARASLRPQFPQHLGDDLSPDERNAQEEIVWGWYTVAYSRRDKLKLAEKLLHSTIEETRHIDRIDAPLDNRLIPLAEFLIDQVIAVAAFMKHEAFAIEKKVRLFGQLPLSYRAVSIHERHIGLSPYCAEVRSKQKNRPAPEVIIEARLGPGTPTRKRRFSDSGKPSA